MRGKSPAAVALVALSLLAACKPPSSGPEGAAGSPANQTMVVATSSQLKTLDPGRTFETTGQFVEHHIYDTLLTFKGGDVSKLEPSIAESHESNDDATRFTFELRDDVTFSDGSTLDAKDVVFSLQRVKNLKSNASPILAGVESIEAPDSDTVVITTSTPDPALPYKLTQPSVGILNADVVRQQGGDSSPAAARKDKAEQFLNKSSAGSGPYTLERWTRGSAVVLERNEEYWGEKPHFQRIQIQDTDASTQGTQVMQGSADLALDLNARQAAQLKNVEVSTSPGFSLWWVLLNANPKVSKVTADPDFREAVWYAIDYASLVERTPGAKRVAGIIPQQITGALDPETAVRRDLARAKSALARSGYDGQTLEMTYPSDVQVDGLSFGDVASVVQADLKEAGINIKLDPQPTQTALVSYRKGTQVTGLWETMIAEPHPNGYLVFVPGTPGNYMAKRMGWSEDESLSGIARQARAEADPEKSAQLFRQLQEEMKGSAPIVPLFMADKVLVANPDLTGVVYNPMWLVDLASIGTK